MDRHNEKLLSAEGDAPVKANITIERDVDECIVDDIVEADIVPLPKTL